MSRFDCFAKDRPRLGPAIKTVGRFLDTHPDATEIRAYDIRKLCGQSLSLAELCVALIFLEERGYFQERFEVFNPATWTAAPELFAGLQDIPGTLKDASGVEFDTDKGEVGVVYVLTEKAKIAATAPAN